MTELEIKVKNGHLYFPKGLKNIYPEGQRIVAWFCKGKNSKLLIKFGLSQEERDFLVGQSNQYIEIEEHDKFKHFLENDVKDLARNQDHPFYAYEHYLRTICRYCDDYVVGSTNTVKAPELFTNFAVGNFVIVSHLIEQEVVTEVWEKEVWESIKSYLIEKKKLKKKDIQTVKYQSPKKTDEEIREELKSLLK